MWLHILFSSGIFSVMISMAYASSKVFSWWLSEIHWFLYSFSLFDCKVFCSLFIHFVALSHLLLLSKMIKLTDSVLKCCPFLWGLKMNFYITYQILALLFVFLCFVFLLPIHTFLFCFCVILFYLQYVSMPFFLLAFNILEFQRCFVLIRCTGL